MKDENRPCVQEKRNEKRGEERKKDEREKGVCLYNWGEGIRTS